MPFETISQKLRDSMLALRHDSGLWRRFAYAGAVQFPEWFRRYAPPVVGTMFYAGQGDTRRAVTYNQSRLLDVPETSLRAHQGAQRVFAQFAHCLTDSLEMMGRPERDFEREYVDRAHFEQARARGRGVIIVTAHTGNWEVGGRLLGHLHGVRTTMVMADEVNAAARTYVESLRQRSGMDVLYTSRNDPTTAVTLLHRLRNNENVAVQIDRPPPSETVIETRMLGARWPVPIGPFRLAQASGAPVLPIFLRRSGYRRYVFTVSEPIDVPRSRNALDLESSAQQAVTALERFVRTYPDQWFHFRRLPSD